MKDLQVIIAGVVVILMVGISLHAICSGLKSMFGWQVAEKKKQERFI